MSTHDAWIYAVDQLRSGLEPAHKEKQNGKTN